MNRTYENELLTALEAAEVLRRSPGAVRNLVMRRKIPYRKAGGRLYFLRSELVAWVQDSPGVTLEEVRR